MNKSKSTMAQQIAQAAIAFEQRRTGNHVPKSVTVVLNESLQPGAREGGNHHPWEVIRRG